MLARSFFAFLPLVAALLGAPTARAEAPAPAPPPQKIVYDLTLDGQPIGTRELTIRYLPREDGERRVLEAYTAATVAGQTIACRSSGQSSARGATFTTSLDQAGAISQVQGIELPGGGWRVIVADAAGVKESTLGKDDARLTTLDVLDPGRTPLLAGGGELKLLVVETGEVYAGTLDAGQVGTTKVGNTKVTVTRYTATGPLGSATFDIDENGILVKSQMRWLGVTVAAAARAVPAPRSYGTIDLGTPTGITEDTL